MIAATPSRNGNRTMSLDLAILTIGDELLNGDIADTNTPAMARLLGDLGYRVRERLSVGDDAAAIGDALRHLATRNRVVLVSGGLGPTGDDLTAAAAAGAFSRRLVPNALALEQIQSYFAGQGRSLHPRDEKQALLPDQATVLPNARGTAPGFLLREGGCSLFFLPGVPAEMLAMLQAAVLPCLVREQPPDRPLRQRVLKLFGLAEPRCEELLLGAGLPPEVELAFAVSYPEVHVKLRAEGAAAESLLDRAEAATRRVCGDFLIATGTQSLAGNVAGLLTAGGLSLALAESCTGGLIAKLLTDLPGASRFLERGAVTYANRAKQDWLGVAEAILAGPGAVSSECALAMVRGVRRAAAADLALAVTGIAGPDGGTAEKPVGTVFIALADGDRSWARRFFFPGDRAAVRTQSAYSALAWLQQHLATGRTA